MEARWGAQKIPRPREGWIALFVDRDQMEHRIAVKLSFARA